MERSGFLTEPWHFAPAHGTQEIGNESALNEILAFAVILANGAGQFALIAILLGSLRRSGSPPLLSALAKGSLFSVCGLIAMHAPAEVAPGVFVDLRGVMVGLAGAFAGWPATLMAAVATSLYRISLGGIVVAGCASIAIAAAMGLLWRRLVHDRRDTKSARLVLLGLMIVLHPLPLAFVPLTWQAAILLPTLATLLIASVLGALVLGKLVEREERLIAQERRLADDATRDPLTGLLNRRGFEQEYFLFRTARPDDTVAVLLLDVDHFKAVNDTHGHDAGDLVLRSIAGTLSAGLPSEGRASRHGGEEFAVLVPGLPAAEVTRVAEEIRRAVAETPVAIRPAQSLSVTLSIGIGLCQDGRTALQDILGQADRALYRAKNAGRNRVEGQWAEAGASRLRLASSK